jgi:hypothetical protein
MLRQKLAGSKFGDDESIGEMVAAFEGRVRHFRASYALAHRESEDKANF